MPVIKSKVEHYRVLKKGECASIVLREWTNPRIAGQAVSYGGEVLVHAPQGNFGYSWSPCAVPFKQFLREIERDSFMTKCMGKQYQAYDGPATVRKFKHAMLRSRRDGVCGQPQARHVWDEFQLWADDANLSEAGFIFAVSDLCGPDSALGEASQYLTFNPTGPAVEFWAGLWAEFVAILQAELEPATEPAEVPAVSVG